MAHGFEKRVAPRVPHHATIRYFSEDNDDYRLGRMINHSTTGMYLELDYPPPKLGARLLIEVLDTRPDTNEWSPEEARDALECYYAKVIWKRNLDHASRAAYGVGLCYLHPQLDD